MALALQSPERVERLVVLDMAPVTYETGESRAEIGPRLSRDVTEIAEPSRSAGERGKAVDGG